MRRGQFLNGHKGQLRAPSSRTLQDQICPQSNTTNVRDKITSETEIILITTTDIKPRSQTEGTNTKQNLT